MSYFRLLSKLWQNLITGWALVGGFILIIIVCINVFSIIGGIFLIPLQGEEKSNLRLSSLLGLKLIQGTPLRGFQSSFLSNHAELGVVYQKLLYENAPENERIDFWVYPQFLLNQINKEDLVVFFNNQIKPFSMGYGLQTGVEFNQRLRLILLLNQIVNTLVPNSLGIPVLRFTLVYRF